MSVVEVEDGITTTSVSPTGLEAFFVHGLAVVFASRRVILALRRVIHDAGGTGLWAASGNPGDEPQDSTDHRLHRGACIHPRRWILCEG